jgi:hypothetical protein
MVWMAPRATVSEHKAERHHPHGLTWTYKRAAM